MSTLEATSSMENQAYNVSLRSFLTVFFKNKYKIATVFLAVVVTVTALSFILPPVYQSNASVLVKFGREYMARPQVGDIDYSIPFQSFSQHAMRGEIEVIRSRDLIKNVITAIGLENIYPDLVGKPTEAAISTFEKSLTAYPIKKSNVIAIEFLHSDPEIVAKAVNVLVELFKEKHLKVLSAPNALFLEKQVAKFKQQLNESEKKLERFKQDSGIVVLSEQKTLLLKQRVDLDTSLKNSENRIKELNNKNISLKRQMKGVSKQVPLYSETGPDRYKIIDEAKSKLLTLRLREQNLLQKFEPGNRLVVGVREEIKLVREFLKKQENQPGRIRTGKNAVYEQMEIELIKATAEISALEAKKLAIKAQLTTLDDTMEGFGLKENELVNLEREVSTHQRNHETYLKRLEEAQISEVMDQQKITNISVIQEATVPIKPIKPKKLLNIILGLFVGVFSALTVAIFCEFFRQEFATPDSVESKLGLPVLAAVTLKGP